HLAGRRLGPHRAARVRTRARPPRRRTVLGTQDPSSPAVAGEPADQHHEERGNYHADHERNPTARDRRRDDHRHDADGAGHQEAHRVAPGMHEASEHADDRSYDDEPYPVHEAVLPTAATGKRRYRG